jgi:hypothetical protein
MEEREQIRAIEHLRLSMAELQVADARTPGITFIDHRFGKLPRFKPALYRKKNLNTMLDEVIAGEWL